MLITEFDTVKIEDEFLNFLYSNLYTFDIRDRVNIKTKTITTSTDKIYHLSNKLAFIKNVNYDGDDLKYGKHYLIVYRGDDLGSIELVFTPEEDKDLIVEYGEQKDRDKFIYPDFPRSDLRDESYPRIGFRITWSRELAGKGDGINLPIKNSGLLQIKIAGLTINEINKIGKEVDKLIINNYKNFYFIRYIDVQSINDYDNFDDNTTKPFEKIYSYQIPDKYQIGG